MWRALGRCVQAVVITSSLTHALGCGGEGPEPDGLVRPLVYGADDRREYFEVDDAQVRARVASSAAVLVPKTALAHTERGIEVRAQSWGEVAHLCPDEPFADQPAAAFCSAVLVDHDLLLTSGHCTRAYHPSDLVAVFGYYYAVAGSLRLTADDLYPVVEIVDEALDPADSHPGLDHAFLRLARPVAHPRGPAPVHISPDALHQGASLVAISAVGGVPLKVDTGGVISATGAPWFDHFSASTDTARGSSGGGAFDESLTLLGVLARGGEDLSPTESGCFAMYHRAPGEGSEEEFTFAGAAIERLCARRPAASSLCRPSCGDPCLALPPPPATGCTFAARGAAPPIGWPLTLVALVGARGRRRLQRAMRRLSDGPLYLMHAAGDAARRGT
jgi:hypothetical protein